MTRKSFYPKPQAAGGRIIRKVIGALRDHQIALPLDSHIHLAVSGGADSVALAILLAKYGRRIQPDLKKITLLHINHGWRGIESDQDAKFVEKFAQKLGVNSETYRLAQQNPREKKSHSPEAWARRERKEVFAKCDLVWTAHHQDDQFETLLWRLFSGQSATHGGGIFFRANNELRPFLNVTREELREFLKEEKQAWREDSSNEDTRFLRNRLRHELIPLIEKIFPRAKNELLALAAGNGSQGGGANGLAAKTTDALAPLFGLRSLGLAQLGRAQIQAVSKHLAINPNWVGKIDLPKNWQLVRERSSQSHPQNFLERWSVVLPKDSG